jgi:hypothetical protein
MFPVLAGNNPTGYNLTRSLRFRASASAYLNRTPATTSGNQIFTISAWVKRGSLGVAQNIFNAYQDTNNSNSIGFASGDQFQIAFYDGGAYSTQLITTQVFRDPSAWYHFIVAIDTTQATANNRAKIYVNGIQITSFSTETYPAQNTSLTFNKNVFHTLGAGYYVSLNGFCDCYLAEINWLTGQQLTPSSFGSTNALTGVWQPAAYTGTYGTNGFYLPFTDNSTAAALGTDFSGNSNTWTVNNISITAGVTYDSMTDVPTLTSATAANYCTLNPLKSNSTLSQGNLYSVEGAAGSRVTTGTIGMTSGKYYWEVTIGSTGNMLGVSNSAISASDGSLSATGNGWGYASDGTLFPGSVTGNASYTTNDVIGLAFNADTGVLSFYKNNVLQIRTFTGLTSGPYFPANGNSTGCSQYYNFGQRPFAYTPPTGFVALNTFNLPTATIVKGNTVMDATLYTGTGAAQNITNTASFRPDFVWTKSRSIAASHILVDSVRGASQELSSNDTSAETTNSNRITSFNSNGWSLGSTTAASLNQSAATYVGWQWQAGQGTTSSNTAGSITSTVSVNASAGFSVVTYTGVSPSGTVGHGLGVTPKLIIVKQRSSAGNGWPLWLSGSTSATQFLYLNSTGGISTSVNFWNSTLPTSSVFSVGNDSATNTTGSTYVAYCWSEIDGYSKFGSYTGNGSADGTFVYTGFRSKFVLVKRTDAAGYNWRLLDTMRDPVNVVTGELYPNSSSQELFGTIFDIISSGFKLRSADAGANASGGTYIYMAFAENPFKNALAR